ncbi:MAG: TonB-dependent receptor [Bacteroidota bacterium]|nr:TonB-dependent receptor [Bacteroidota bacterium]
MEKNFLIFVFFISTGFCTYAQTIVKGTVKDVRNEPLVGTSVYIKNTTIGTVTDMDGKFQLEISSGIRDSTLVFSQIGFVTREITIENKTDFNVQLNEDTKLLSEIIITGYTAQEKEKITGAVATVSAENLVRLPVPSIDQALQGRAPGVVISQNTGAPGEGVSVRIRGIGSINSGNNPLYVVDGIPTLDITGFSTHDIENISILKDASAAALYGSRAANGVVIITTKSGEPEKPQIRVHSQVGVQQASRLIDMTNTADYATIFNEAAAADNATKNNPIFYRSLITDEMRTGLSDVDYIDAIMRDAILQTHSISVSGGENKTRYFVSANYFDQEGIIKGSDFKRISGRMNISSQVKEWMRTGINLNIANSTANIIGSSGDGAGGNGGSVVRYAFFRTPAIPIYDEQGVFTDRPERFDLFGDGYSPVGLLDYNNNERINNQVFGKAFIEISPSEGLKFTSNFGLDINHQNQRRFDRNWGTENRINNPNQLTVWSNRFQTFTFSNFLTYNKNINDHNLNFLLGTEAIKVRNYDFVANERNFADQETNLVYLGNGLGLKNTNEGLAGNTLLSFFGKIDYDFNDKYLASITLRRDGSSRFGPENRWGNFYAGSLGWRVDKEAFLVNNKFIDKLLLRVGYGSIGNQEIGNYAYTDRISADYNYAFGNTKGNGYAVSNLGNSRVRWETSNQLNAGMDLQVLEGSLIISFDYFNKITEDLLVMQPLASSAGKAEAPWVNNGKILNRGFELGLNYENNIGAFTYSINANGATLYNEVLEVNAPIVGGAIGSDRITRTEVGYPIGSFFLYEMEGIFQDEVEIFTHAYQGSKIAPGDVMFKDHDGNGIIDGNDRVHVGSAIPKLTAGLNISLGYKNFDLSVFFQGAYGQKIFSVLNRDIEGFYRPFNVTQRYFDNRWTGPGTSNEFPRASWDASGNNTRYSTRFLEDGSYTRLKNLQIGYSIPGNTLSKIGLSELRIYLSGTNLLTFTKYQGMDPEMTTSDNAKGEGDRSVGMDWGTYPSAKSYNLGVNLAF